MVISLSIVGLVLTVIGIYLTTTKGGTTEEQKDSPWNYLVFIGGFILLTVFSICLIHKADEDNKKEEDKEQLKKLEKEEKNKKRTKENNNDESLNEDDEEKDDFLGESFKEIGKDIKDSFKNMF